MNKYLLAGLFFVLLKWWYQTATAEELLFLLAPTDVSVAAAALLAAVADGTLTEQRIDESVLRLLRLKIDLGLTARPPVAAPADEAEG